MAQFQYVITDKKGIRREDRLRASNLDIAMQTLSKKGYKVVSLREIKATAAATALPPIHEQITTFIQKVQNHIPLSVLVFFTRQLSTMFSAGLTIEKSITNLMVEEKNHRFRKILAKVGNDIKKGMGLSDAFALSPGVFDGLYVALVHAGEVSGSLHVILEELSDYLEVMSDTRQKVISALSYPIFVAIFMSVIVAGLLLFVVPQFAEIYAKFGARLPGPTRALVTLSQIVSTNFVLVLLVTIGSVVAGWFASMTEKGGRVFDTIMLHFPVFGLLVQNSLMNRFAKTFGILLGSGVPVLESLSHVQKVVRNRVLVDALETSKMLIRDGYAISVALKKTDVFPPTLIQLIATGEETGEMDKLLDKAAYFYAKQVDAIVERLTSLIEPLMIVSIGAVVCSIIVVIYLPIFKLGMALQRGL
ncbi:MAG: type II secretion system F family protein [Candidatus Hatepunaea meridiana]|nr:type II secretion system F family protein [Candidatus Hatepunaea meridiana]